MDSPSTPWHALTGDETCRALEIGQAGLDEAEALERQQRFGPNRLPVTPAHPWLLRFFDQFRNVLIYILLVPAPVSALLGHAVDAAVIAAVAALYTAPVQLVPGHVSKQARHTAKKGNGVGNGVSSCFLHMLAPTQETRPDPKELKDPWNALRNSFNYLKSHFK